MEGEFKIKGDKEVSKAEFLILPKKTKRKHFVMMGKKGLRQLALGTWTHVELRSLLYLASTMEISGFVRVHTAVDISRETGMSEKSVSHALKKLFQESVIYRDVVELENGEQLDVWKISSYFAERGV